MTPITIPRLYKKYKMGSCVEPILDLITKYVHLEWSYNKQSDATKWKMLIGNGIFQHLTEKMRKNIHVSTLCSWISISHLWVTQTGHIHKYLISSFLFHLPFSSYSHQCLMLHALRLTLAAMVRY